MSAFRSLVVLALSSTVGCTALLGIDDDYALGGAGGTGSTSTSMGASMTSGSGMMTGSGGGSMSTGEGGSLSTGSSMGCEAPKTWCGSDAGCRDLTTDNAHCGECDYACEGACTSGRCAPKPIIKQTLGKIVDFAVEGDWIYWTVDTALDNSGSVMKASASDGGGETTLAMNENHPSAITVTNGVVFWAQNSSIDLSATVRAYGYNGNMSPQTAIPGLTRLTDITTNGQSVYWINTSGAVGRLDLSMGQSNSVSSEVMLFTNLVADLGSVYVTHDAGNVSPPGLKKFEQSLTGNQADLHSASMVQSHVAMNDTQVFWADNASSGSARLMMIQKSGKLGSAMPLISNAGKISGIAATSDAVYWTNRDIKAVSKESLGSTMTHRVLNANQEQARGVVVSGEFVYWLSTTLGIDSIRRLPK